MEERNDIANEPSAHPKVLVIGGGVGGIRAALDLAESRRNVILIDKAYAIGGLMTQLDRTFPTNNCDLCTVSPDLSEGGRQHRMELMPMTTLVDIQGEAGNFTVTLETAPRHIDVAKCTACGECVAKYPGWVRFTPGLDPRAPTCMRYPQATPFAFSVDMEKVEDIKALQAVCRAEAILSDDRPRTATVNVASVVLSIGAELFDPAVLDHFGGGQLANVVTGLQYERIMSASGPTAGELVRPSDGIRPKKVAWIQCVGSRGINRADVPYCSSVCCMYALKEAIVTKERFASDIEATIFYMDMRTCGKDYELYLNRAKNDYGVQLIRSRPHSIIEDPQTGNLSITYTTDEESRHLTEVFDMVVLSTGFRVQEPTVELARRLGIELNTHLFAKTEAFSPVSTSKPGIYVCGVFESPKDIPETMVQASAAACMAGADLHMDLSDPQAEDDFPPERDVSGEPPKIGVFVCDCGFDIGGVIPVNEVVASVAKLSDVVVAESVGYGCSGDSMLRIEQMIKEHDLNRVVIGGCSPRTHETRFQDLLRRVGLNKYLVDIVNLRDQDTWAHMDRPADAAKKAEKLLRMGITGVRKSRPLVDHTLPVNQNILVVGGGVTGMNAALQMAELGFKVYLIDRAPDLGGLARSVRSTIEGGDVSAYIADLVQKVKANDKIQVMTRTIIVDHSGMPGLFTTGVQSGPRMNYMQIQHGAAILATGAMPNRPREYLLGENDGVMTQLDLDSVIADQADQAKDWNQVVMIQCVGSREPDNPNCSRICCATAIKNALRLKALNADTQIYVLYRDMRTYGFSEDYYAQARQSGVKFIRYQLDDKPVVAETDGQLTVTALDPVLGRRIEIAADKVILSTGFRSDDETTEDLAMLFHVARTDDGYFLEDHVKLRPVDMALKGFFIAGTAHSPKNIKESITQALAAAGRAQALLAKTTINLGASIAKVDGNKCAACLVCVRACPFGVPFINADGYSEIDPAKCHGCGVCAADCPAKAIQLMTFEDDQILAKLEGLFERLN
jgi:heterodisulfide reductase subunit A2